MDEPDADFDGFAVRAADSALLIANDRSFNDFQTPSAERQNRAARQRSAFVSARLARCFLQNRGAEPAWRISRKMNTGPEIRDAIRVRRMKDWQMRARCPLLAKGYPAWKCRKNYLSLVRKHRALAERHGFQETDVF
jgi:hypothetical protein